MTKKLIGWAEQVLFASVVFVLFLLLFNNRLVVPLWLQPVGRMHPVLLHFPIVILLLAMVLEAFRSRLISEVNTEVAEFYRNFLNNLLLIGALLAGFTVIMGLFLAKEDGYSGRVLNWHKWLGVGVFLVATLIYWSRTNSWYTNRLARLGALTTVLLLLGAGHYGATLTHGDNFLFAPVSTMLKSDPVALDKALVYTDVIQPIFEQKCLSCHNPDKLKGQLSLASAEDLLKGGKSGKLFVAGKPDSSLLLQRIHLPLVEKKHMPPSGKSQLTPQEMLLLALWIKSNAELTKKVIDLPATDSLRMVAASLFKPAEQTDVFDFDAADEETVRALSTNYRTVAPLANESPALAVNFYNKAAFSVEKLAELKPVREQVVYLNLNKMPVKDADLKAVGDFKNLRKLDINFTDITGAGLSELTLLPELQTLTLAGTNVTYDALQKQLSRFKKLKSLAVWNTKITPAQVAQLQKANMGIQFIAGFDGASSKPIRLNPPQLKNSSPIFVESLPLQLKHPVKGVQIRYTTDGSEPDSVHSPVFAGQTILTKPTLLKAKAYKAGWYGSAVATFDLYKSTYKPDSVNLLLPLNPVHQADGAHTFFDGKLGTFNANSPAWANNWAGFRKNEMALVSEFKTPVQVSSVALRVMVEPETGIFPPSVVEIWGGNRRDQLRLIATINPSQPTAKSSPALKAVLCPVKSQQVSFLKIIAQPVKKLPDWHPNKGNSGLLLVDEVFIN
ncbi:c-type cytochrome domain-containing protein [Spirosoma sp. SC4-14]|uniref:c-type cytochrome domain-containing protein n=1 Tax=Spirosoma sp. SC4-14 TaxID=3128900 RepID=UPI0030D34A42